ncbi:MAG: hypothetical protein RBR82_12720 [Pseudomonas sp.]|nr:hypothetical protein [Pseudomonas sp.]
MESKFARSLDRMNRTIAARLSDIKGSYDSKDGAIVNSIDLMIDSSVVIGGVEQTFAAGTFAISFPVCQLIKAARGGVFTAGSRSYIVEEPISNDGRYATYACMEIT